MPVTMSETDARRSLKTVPDLPQRLVDLEPAVVVGSLLWTGALIVFLLLEYVFKVDTGFWIGTSIAGIGLGGFGLFIVALQRRAARRGDKGATPNLWQPSRYAKSRRESS